LLLSETVRFDRCKTRFPMTRCLAASCQQWLA